jgi:hypothetical protein
MNNGKYVKMDTVIEGVYRDYGFDNLDWIHCIEWIGECLDLIGAPLTYIEKATDGNEKLGHKSPIIIEENRGKLPCDMHKLISSFYNNEGNWIPMRVNTDSTHIAYFCNMSEDAHRNSDITYKLNNNYIFTDFKEGEVMMVYMANPTDENGYPMIPDNVKYKKACQAYIAQRVLLKKRIQGKSVSGDVVMAIDQDCAWYTAAADSSSRIPTIDKMESWKNNFLKLIPDVNSHATAFRGDGVMERRFNNSYNEARNKNNLR